MKRRRPRERVGPAGELLLRRALDLVRRARGLARLMAREEGFPLPGEDVFQARLGISFSAGKDLEAARALLAAWKEAFQARAFREEGPVPGRIYCFRCGSFHCSHSAPRDPREVFAGYSPTGRPDWVDFVAWCIDRREAGVEDLLQDRSRVVAFVQAGRDLHKDQLGVFGGEDPNYRILGQVTAGFFRAPGREEGRFALTVQVLLLRGRDGGPLLSLNPLCRYEGILEGDPALREILAGAGKALDLLSMQVAGLERSRSSIDPEEKVLPLLRRLARDLEHDSLDRVRRTGHGRKRARQRVRPTESAYPEARKAQDEGILVDTLEGTIIVLGANNRVHVFTRDARHVTSFHMGGDMVQRRIRRRRWRGADPAERGAFRGALRAREGRGKAGEGEGGEGTGGGER